MNGTVEKAEIGSFPRPHLFTEEEFRRMRLLGCLSGGEVAFSEGQIFFKTKDGLRPYRFTEEEYHRLGEIGVLPERGVELIRGEVIDMCPVGDDHVEVVKRLGRLLNRQVPDGYDILVQSPIRLPDLDKPRGVSEPEPDVTVHRSRKGIPYRNDIIFLIEVADTSGGYDRQEKLPEYARHGIAEVWLFDLRKGVVEVHLEPSGGRYRKIERYGLGDRLRPRYLPGLDVDLSQHFSEYLREVERDRREIGERERGGSGGEWER